MENSKQHVQLPNNMLGNEDLQPKDLLVYAVLKKYMNSKTKECFPSLETLSKETTYSINTIRNSLTLLVENSYITIRKEGRSNIYKFNPHKNFEPLSYDFLECTKLEANEKAYILAYQQFMIKDSEGIGKTSYSNEMISEKLNISTRTIARLDSSLVKKGFLNIVKTSAKDNLTGLVINEKFFHLDELGQAIIWTLQKHDKDIEGLKKSTESNSKDIKIVLKENDLLKQEMEELKKRLSLLEDIEFKII